MKTQPSQKKKKKIEVAYYENHTTYSPVLPSTNLITFPRNSIPEDLFLQVYTKGAFDVSSGKYQWF